MKRQGMGKIERLGRSALTLLLRLSLIVGSSHEVAALDQALSHQLASVPHISVPTHAADGSRVSRLLSGTVMWGRTDEYTITYSTDLSLASIVHYPVRFTIYPKLHSLTGQDLGIPDGKYLMRMALLRPQVREDANDLTIAPLYKRYITHVSQVVEIVGGTINTDVVFTFRNPAVIQMRNSLLIQILPLQQAHLKILPNGKLDRRSKIVVDPKPEFVANLIRVPFVPRANDNSRPINKVYGDEIDDADQLDLGPFIHFAEQYQQTKRAAEEKLVTPEQMIAAYNFKAFSFNSRVVSEVSQAHGLTAAQFKDLFASITPERPVIPENLARLFCDLQFRYAKQHPNMAKIVQGKRVLDSQLLVLHQQRISGLTQCTSNPMDAFNLTKNYHLKKIRSYQFEKTNSSTPAAAYQLTLAQNFALNRQRTADSFSGLQMGFSPLDLFGPAKWASRLLGYNYTLNESNSRSTSQSHFASGTIGLSVNVWNLNVTIEDYTACLMISPNGEFWPDHQQPPNIYICDRLSASRPQNAVERFFHIFPSTFGEASVDVYDPMGQVVNMTLRSDRDYNSFARAIHKIMTPVNYEKRTPSDDVRAAVKVWRGGVPAAHGVLQIPVVLSGPRSEDIIRALKDPKSAFDYWRPGQRHEKFD